MGFPQCSLTTTRLPHNIEATLQQWGYLKKLRLLPNNEAASQEWGYFTTKMLSCNNKGMSQQLDYRVSHKTVSTFVFWISRFPWGLEIPSWTFFNSPFPIIRIKRWRRAFNHQNIPHKDIGTSMRRSSRSAFGRTTGNDVNGHYKGIFFLLFFHHRLLFS